MTGPDAVTLDSESHVRHQPDRLVGSARVGHIPVVPDERPGRRLAAVVEGGLTDELDLDRALEALDRAYEHMVGVVVCRWTGVRRDRVLVVARPHR